MRKCLIAIFTALCIVLTGCSGANQPQEDPKPDRDEKIVELSKKDLNDYSWDELSQISDECISQINDGEEPKNIQVNPDIDAGYAAKFQKMWKESGKEEKSIGLYDKLSLDENTEEFAKISKYKIWLADNFGTIALNAAYGTLTLEDFDLGMKLYTNESYRKATDTSDMNVFSVVGPTAELLMKYLDWMESQGAQPNDKFQTLKAFQHLMTSPK